MLASFEFEFVIGTSSTTSVQLIFAIDLSSCTNKTNFLIICCAVIWNMLCALKNFGQFNHILLRHWFSSMISGFDLNIHRHYLDTSTLSSLRHFNSIVTSTLQPYRHFDTLTLSTLRHVIPIDTSTFNPYRHFDTSTLPTLRLFCGTLRLLN